MIIMVTDNGKGDDGSGDNDDDGVDYNGDKLVCLLIQHSRSNSKNSISELCYYQILIFLKMVLF